MPKEVEHWSLTTLRVRLAKIDAKVAGHGRYVTFQLVEVAVPRELVRKIMRLIDGLRPRPAPASAGKIAGKVTGAVCLDGEKIRVNSLSERGPIAKIMQSDGSKGDYSSLEGGTVVRFPRTSISSGECRFRGGVEAALVTTA